MVLILLLSSRLVGLQLQLHWLAALQAQLLTCEIRHLCQAHSVFGLSPIWNHSVLMSAIAMTTLRARRVGRASLQLDLIELYLAAMTQAGSLHLRRVQCFRNSDSRSGTAPTLPKLRTQTTGPVTHLRGRIYIMNDFDVMKRELRDLAHDEVSILHCWCSPVTAADTRGTIRGPSPPSRNVKGRIVTT